MDQPLITVWVVTGFNERKLPNRTIAIVVDSSKVFEMVSHSLFIEMTHCSQLRHNLVRWLVAYLCDRKELCLYQRNYLFSCQVQAQRSRGRTGIHHLLKPSSNNLCRTALSLTLAWRPMLTKFMLLASAPTIVEVSSNSSLRLFCYWVILMLVTQCGEILPLTLGEPL